MKSRKPTANRLPPATPSEAAFERALETLSCGAQPREERKPPEERELPEETIDEFVARLFEKRGEYLSREPFARIGEAEEFRTKVVGVSFEGRQDLVAGLQAGYELTLERQPHNPHDANAIAVKFGALQVGFLRAQIAAKVAPNIDSGIAYRARVLDVTGGRGKNFGVNVVVGRVMTAGAFAEPAAALRLRLSFGSGRDGNDKRVVQQALLGDYEPHEPQREVLARLDAGKNTLAVFGTGRGKSFCFQYVAACRALESEAKTLVIYPLRALANDQYEALRRRLDGLGLRIHRANGSISSQERDALSAALSGGDWDVVLATPEFLQYHRGAFSGKSRPSLVVVDEAHHLYESTHRTAYGSLGEAIVSLGDPQVLALTATAGDEAFARIVRDLRISAWVIDPTVRENLHLVDARGRGDQRAKIAYLRNLFATDEKGIVYCNSRKEATDVAQALRPALGESVMFYHAGMPSPERAQVETFFRQGSLRTVVATSAFGEGIDLPDVRHVVLYHLNFDFTEFNQQAGRAGRDGLPAHVHLLYGDRDRSINEFIIDRENPTLPTLREIYRQLRTISRDGRLSLHDTEELARTLALDKVDRRTIEVALQIFGDEGLLEMGHDDDGPHARFLTVNGRVDISKNERMAEGEAERESFARFCELALRADVASLERIVNRPIYPQRGDLRR